ncbi:MAG: signal peptidase I [Pseudomonadota bacterium]
MAKTAAQSSGGFFDTVKTIFWALLIAGAFRTILFQPFSIPSGSMKPELVIGDYLFVSKFAYGYSRYSLPFSPNLDWLLGEGRVFAREPERGDVVVFKHPKFDECSEGAINQTIDFAMRLTGLRSGPGTQDCVDYVKRIVGLPGDAVQVKAGILHINGEALPTRRMQDYIERRIPLGSPPRMPRCINAPVPRGGDCAKEQYEETLPGGRAYRVLNIEGEIGAASSGFLSGGADNTPEFLVPDGHFFFMGDNRDNSVDSRFQSQVGVVPFKNLIGRADIVALSAEGPFWQLWNWRFSRFLKSIN